MTETGHLWAVGYDSMERAAQARDEIASLAASHYLTLLDTAVAVRYRDGLITLDGEPVAAVKSVQGRTFASLLAGLALGAPPLTATAVGAVLRGTGTASDAGCISEDFIRQVESLITPGTSALFVLDHEGDMDATLRGIRGLGGTVLKTTVNVERAKLIQSTLAAVDNRAE